MSSGEGAGNAISGSGKALKSSSLRMCSDGAFSVAEAISGVHSSLLMIAAGLQLAISPFSLAV